MVGVCVNNKFALLVVLIAISSIVFNCLSECAPIETDRLGTQRFIDKIGQNTFAFEKRFAYENEHNLENTYKFFKRSIPIFNEGRFALKSFAFTEPSSKSYKPFVNQVDNHPNEIAPHMFAKRFAFTDFLPLFRPIKAHYNFALMEQPLTNEGSFAKFAQ